MNPTQAESQAPLKQTLFLRDSKDGPTFDLLACIFTPVRCKVKKIIPRAPPAELRQLRRSRVLGPSTLPQNP